MSWVTCYSVRDGAGASGEGYVQGGGSERVQTSGAAAATGGRHAKAETAAAGVGHTLADVARTRTGDALAELRDVEDVHLIFFGVGQEAAAQVLTRAEHALIVGGADAVAAALHARANLRVLAVRRTKLRLDESKNVD